MPVNRKALTVEGNENYYEVLNFSFGFRQGESNHRLTGEPMPTGVTIVIQRNADKDDDLFAKWALSPDAQKKAKLLFMNAGQIGRTYELTGAYLVGYTQEANHDHEVVKETLQFVVDALAFDGANYHKRAWQSS